MLLLLLGVNLAERSYDLKYLLPNKSNHMYAHFSHPVVVGVVMVVMVMVVASAPQTPLDQTMVRPSWGNVLHAALEAYLQAHL